MPEQTDRPTEKLYYDQRSVTLRTTQALYFVQEHDKVSMLGLLLNDYKEVQTVIVVKSKKEADRLSNFLIEKEFKALSIHGNHREAQQTEASKAFNLGTLKIIITTDMIFKTLELDNIKLVVSYNLAENPQDYYTHLASMKELGEAIALVSPEEERFLNEIEFNMKQEIEEKILEGFIATEKPHKENRKKERKPRHRKNKVRKEKE